MEAAPGCVPPEVGIRGARRRRIESRVLRGRSKAPLRSAGDAGALDEPVIGPEPPEADALRLRLDVPEAVAEGESVPLGLHVENVSGRRLELHLRGREIAFDVSVSRPGGTTVWRRLDGVVIPGILRLEPLGPRESLVLSASWDQRSNEGEPVARGVYMVGAELLTDGDPLTFPETPLRVIGRR